MEINDTGWGDDTDPGNGAATPGGTPTGLPSVTPDPALYVPPDATDHAWPGHNITVPFTKTVDPSFVLALPEPEGYVGYGGGYDPVAIPFLGSGGFARVVYNIVGMGRDVQFYVEGTGVNPIELNLTDSEKVDLGDGYNKRVRPRAVGSSFLPRDDPNWSPATAAIKWFLVEGRTYQISVDSLPSGDTYVPEPWTLMVRFASALDNNHRDDALEVIITSNGGTYMGPRMLNTGYTASAVSADDGPLLDTYCTAWWRYEPREDTTFRASCFTFPLKYHYARVTVYRASAIDGTLSTLFNSSDNPAVFDVTVSAHDVIYFQFGLSHAPVQDSGWIDAQLFQLRVRGAKSVLQPPPPPDPADDPDIDPRTDPGPYVPPPSVPWDSGELPVDKYNPDAIAKAETESGSATLLELVRAFSSAVRRAVRITGTHTIEMVDPAVPLPAGWTNDEAGSLYTSTIRSATATEKVLSIRAGDVKLAAAAHIKSDDVRVVRSSWRIPDRLPVYGLPAAPVKSVTYTFSPTGFDASVEFHFAGVPLAARRV